MWKLLLPILLATRLAYAEAPVSNEAIDPVDVAPELYEVLLENEHVRIVRYRVMPGGRDTWHTHPSKVSVVTSGGTLRVTLGDGESFEVTEEKGTALWMQPLAHHFVENVGDTAVQIILVEVKSAPAGPFMPLDPQ